MKARLLLICLLLLGTTACGFHLRGSQSPGFQATNIYIQNTAANRLAKEVALQLVTAGVSIADSAASASYIVNLTEENFEKSVLSVSATTGKVEEYRFVFSAVIDVTDSDGRAIVKDDRMQIIGDFTFTETAALGKFSEQTLLQEELIKRAAGRILRRLRALSYKLTAA